MRLIATSLLLLIQGLGAVWAQGGQPPPPVRIALAEMEPMTTTTQVPGTVISRNDASISAEVEGRLTWVADIGTRLEAGEPVARIEDTTLRLRETELKAQVTREKARLEFLTRETQRLRELEARNVAAKTQLEQMLSERDVAASDLAVAESRLDQVQDQLERTSIEVPFSGIVVERLRQAGERVTVGNPVVRMVNTQSLEVIARAPLEYMDFVAVGDAISMTAAGKDLAGRARTLVAVGDENTHVFEIRMDIPGGVLPVGQTVRVTLPSSAEQTVLSVPRDALVLRPEGIFVFKVDDQNVAHRVSVQTGMAEGSRIEVKGGIEPGDRVIVRGNERLRDGQTVAIQDAAAENALTTAPVSG